MPYSSCRPPSTSFGRISQSPRAPPHPDDSSCLGYHDEFDFDPDLGGIFTDAQALLGDTDDNCRSHMLAHSRRRNGSEKGVDDEDDNGTGQASSLVAGSLASSSPALPPSAFSPLPPGPNDAPHPSNHTGSSSVNKDPENSRRPRHRTTRLPSSTKLAAGTSLRTPGRSDRDGGGGGSSSGSMGLVGLEVRAVDGAEESLSEEKVRSDRSLAQGWRTWARAWKRLCGCGVLRIAIRRVCLAVSVGKTCYSERLQIAMRFLSI